MIFYLIPRQSVQTRLRFGYDGLPSVRSICHRGDLSVLHNAREITSKKTRRLQMLRHLHRLEKYTV
jgi:hypothetical protein